MKAAVQDAHVEEAEAKQEKTASKLDDRLAEQRRRAAERKATPLITIYGPITLDSTPYAGSAGQSCHGSGLAAHLPRLIPPDPRGLRPPSPYARSETRGDGVSIYGNNWTGL